MVCARLSSDKLSKSCPTMFQNNILVRIYLKDISYGMGINKGSHVSSASFSHSVTALEGHTI
jgi:hypothetical protein